VGTSSSTWLYLYPFLIRKYSVVAIDLPGFGFSKVLDSKGFLTLHDHVAAVEQCREHLCLPHSTIILGHSLGGWIAMLCALRSPERTKRLVLINPAGVSTDGVEELRQLFAVQTTADVWNLMERMWYRYPWYFKPFLPAIRKELIARKVPELIRSITREEFLNDRLRELSMPVHLIWGAEDRLLNEQTVRVFEHSVQQLTVEYIRACGHVPQLEKPRELAMLLRKILRVDEEEKPTDDTIATALRL
jgi:pimeloyl-ACP methyl ester carboxylesterase